jgi:cytidine deaminase
MKNKLITAAKKYAERMELDGFYGNNSGAVAAAILTDKGNIYTGVSIVVACGLGFCAEASAIADMLKNKETKIKMAVAITFEGKIIPPCGRCRELMYQVDKSNLDAEIIVGENNIVKLKNLLPETWADKF